MPSRSHKLSRFWQELKRRKVVHVITVYASAAFVIIELINNLTEPLNLPAGLASIVIIILAVGFPMAVILSWIYDLTGEGIEKTRSLSEMEKDQTPKVPKAWKFATYISFVVIIGLVTYNIVGNTKKLKTGDIQSLVILPFDNFTGDDQLDYVAAGMHASLIGDMGRISGLRVISKTTARVYGNMEKSLPEIASELQAEAIVEPTVMCYGDTVCIQIRVMTMYPEEKQLWVADFKEEKSQILNLYNRISRQIADEIMIELTPEEERLLSRTRTVDSDAYDAYLHQMSRDDLSEESLNKALEYLNIAIEKDPEWAPLYAGMANVWMRIQQAGHESPAIAGPKIYEYIDKALKLDPDHADSYYLSAMMASRAEWNWKKAEREFLSALAIHPNDALSRMYYAQLLYILQRTVEASTHARLAFDLDPMNPFVKAMFGVTLLCDGDCEASLALMEEIVAADPDNALANNIIEKAAFQCGDYERVIEAAKYHIPLKAEDFIDIEQIFDEQGFFAAYEEVLGRLEVLLLSDFIINPVTIASKYHMVKQYDKALEWIEKGLALHDPNLPYITLGYYNLTHLYNNPRFINVLEKMNLPLPSN